MPFRRLISPTLRSRFCLALGLSVSQFLFLRHNASPKITHGVFAGADAFDAALQNALYDSWRVYYKLEDQLEDVLELMSTGAVHRIWVVDDERKPIGCVSLVDILALFQQWESPEEQKLSSKKTKEEELTSQFEKRQQAVERAVDCRRRRSKAARVKDLLQKVGDKRCERGKEETKQGGNG